MALDTYANLTTAITDHIGNRADVTSSTVHDWITLCEADVNSRLRNRRMITRTTLTVDGEFENAPADFAGPRTFRFTDTTPITSLDYVTPERMEDLKATTYTTTGTPEVYTVVGSEFEFGPAPSGSNAAGYTYYARIPALSSGVNWLLTYYPTIYFYGALVHAAPYLIDDPRLPVWQQFYALALQAAQDIDKTENTGARLRVGSPLAVGV